jgi:hypothetical protein
MKTINYKSKELDPTIEHELLSESEFGFNVTICVLNERLVEFRNVTEVHWMYNLDKNRVAIESNIHGTGATYYVAVINSIQISDADKIYESL